MKHVITTFVLDCMSIKAQCIAMKEVCLTAFAVPSALPCKLTIAWDHTQAEAVCSMGLSELIAAGRPLKPGRERVDTNQAGGIDRPRRPI